MERRHLFDLNCLFLKALCIIACPSLVMDVMYKFGLGIPLNSAESAEDE